MVCFACNFTTGSATNFLLYYKQLAVHTRCLLCLLSFRFVVDCAPLCLSLRIAVYGTCRHVENLLLSRCRVRESEFVHYSPYDPGLRVAGTILRSKVICFQSTVRKYTSCAKTQYPGRGATVERGRHVRASETSSGEH